ncbi:hypothetical protein J3A83DRAFT_4244114 [Scleroderma citrinum]
MSLLAACRSSLRTPKTAVYYSTAQDTSNVKREVIRRMLYPPNVRNRPSPTGAWRPDIGRALQRAIPSAQAHETIERAWKLYQRHLRKKRDTELQRKFECMQRAMTELEEIDPILFKEANKREDPRARSPAEMEALKDIPSAEKRAVESRIRGLFPTELKVPTDTPSQEGWQHEWRPFDRPLH